MELKYFFKGGIIVCFKNQKHKRKEIQPADVEQGGLLLLGLCLLSLKS